MTAGILNKHMKDTAVRSELLSKQMSLEKGKYMHAYACVCVRAHVRTHILSLNHDIPTMTYVQACDIDLNITMPTVQ